MTKREKRLQRIRDNPKHVRFEQLAKLLEDYGITLYRARGSHHIFVGTVGGTTYRLEIPLHKPHVKPVYVKRVLAVIDQIEEADGDN